MLIGLIQSSKPKLFMLFCQINQPQQNLLSVIAQLSVKNHLTPKVPKLLPSNLKITLILVRMKQRKQPHLGVFGLQY